MGQVTSTIALVLSGDVSITAVKKTVDYYPSSTGPAREHSVTSSARMAVGREVRANVALAVDVDGSYGGPGTIIDRPDHVIRHFLFTRMGFGPAEMDTAAFDSAGTSYASEIPGGYRFSFLLGGKRAPSELLRALALESRSVLDCSSGKWALSFMPDTPPLPVKTISSGDLVDEGSMFVFDRTPLSELANTLVARYGPRSGFSGWEGIATATDSESAQKYGDYTRETELSFIRDKATAESVLGHMLRQRAQPLLTATFSVFFEHFDLGVGDTIEIENQLYGGRRFLIERIKRLDRFTAEIRAVEWWG